MAAILTLTWKKKIKKAKTSQEPGLEEAHYLNVLPSASSLYYDDDSDLDEVPVSVKEGGVAAATSVRGSTVSVPGSSSTTSSLKDEADTGGVRKESSVTFGLVETIEEERVEVGNCSPTALQREKVSGGSKHLSEDKPTSSSSTANRSSISRQNERSDSASRRGGRTRSLQAKERSNLVFVVLVIAYFIVMCWHYPLVLFLVFPLALWALFKRALSLSSTLSSRIRDGIQWVTIMLKEWAWLVAPPPLPTLMRMFLYADRRILRLAVTSMGSLVSAFIIIGLIVGVATTVVVLLLKVQVELSHYMTVGAKVWNMTLEGNPQLAQ